MPAAALYDAAVYDTALYDYPVGYAVVELYINGAWVDVTGYARVADGIQIKRGRSDWSQAPSFATCDLTLDNRDGRFTPRNASGAYYPYLVRNTPLRVSVADDSGTLNVRFWGDVSEWPVDVIAAGADIVTHIQGSGVRRRLNRSAVLQSPYRIAAGGLGSLSAYWPMEVFGAGATSYTAVTANTKPLTVLGTVNGAASTDFSATSGDLPTLVGDQASVQGFVPGYTVSVLGQEVRMLLECDCSTAGQGVDVVVTFASGDYIVAEYVPVANTVQVAYKDLNGTTIANNGPSGVSGSQPWNLPTRISIESVQNGTGVDFGVAWYNTTTTVGTGGFSLSATAAATTLTGVRSVKVINGGTDVTTVVGHITVQNTKTTLFDLSEVTRGYAGETAATRAIRMGASMGITTTVAAAVGGVVSEAMGSQPSGTALDVFDETATVDGGISAEAVDTRGLVMRRRSTLYDQAPNLIMGYTQLDGLVTTDDDQTIENDVTANRVDGGSANYMVTTGNLATGTIGDYPQTYDLNVYTDDQLAYQAQWRATVGTIDEPRRPVIAFDAMRITAAATRTKLIGMREGDRLTLQAVPAALAPTALNQLDVLVLGWTETITETAWHFDFNTRPANPYQQVLILDDIQYGLLDTDRLGL
jgi:hypothetical protein